MRRGGAGRCDGAARRGAGRRGGAARRDAGRGGAGRGGAWQPFRELGRHFPDAVVLGWAEPAAAGSAAARRVVLNPPPDAAVRDGAQLIVLSRSESVYCSRRPDQPPGAFLPALRALVLPARGPAEAAAPPAAEAAAASLKVKRAPVKAVVLNLAVEEGGGAEDEGLLEELDEVR